MVRNMSRSSQAFSMRRISLQTEGSTAAEHAVQTISLQWNLQALITDWWLFIQFNNTHVFTVLIICESVLTGDKCLE